MKKRTKRITEMQLLYIIAVVVVTYIVLVATEVVMGKSQAVHIIENNIHQDIRTTDHLYFDQSELDTNRSLRRAVEVLHDDYPIVILDN